MCILVGSTLVASIVSENVILSALVTMSSPDETKVGGVLSWTCANAYPGSGADKSRIGQVSPAKLYCFRFDAATCPGSPAYDAFHPPAMSVRVSTAASENANATVSRVALAG